MSLLPSPTSLRKYKKYTHKNQKIQKLVHSVFFYPHTI